MTPRPDSSPTKPDPLEAARLLRRRVRTARASPDEFAELCFADPSGRPIRQAAVHRELQDFLGRHARALVELPRDHGKTVQMCARVLWELGRDPSLRVKVVCATEALAEERGRFLRDAVGNNPRLRLVFPDLAPAEPWGATRFTVARPAEVIGPSVAALGVGMASTGTRADLLVCDDIVDVKALHSRAERERVKAYFRENLLNLLEPTGRCWNLSTPWHAEDLNQELKKNPAFALFRRAVGPGLEPVWPEKWPAERLDERRREIGAAAFGRAFRLVTVAPDEVLIRPEWVKFWAEPVECDPIILAIDPAVSAKPSADASALVVLGRSPDNEVRCLAALARRVSAPDLVALIDAVDRQWRPAVILFESNAAFKGIEDLLVRHARFGPKVKGVSQSRNKAARFGAFSVLVENGAFKLHADHKELFDEITTFPFGEHDDLLDAAAFGSAYLLDRPEPRAW
jgi:predicted phage terminase large subunit-like protein